MSKLKCVQCKVPLKKIGYNLYKCPRCDNQFGEEDNLVDTVIDLGIGLALGSIFSSSNNDDSSNSSSNSDTDWGGSGGDSSGGGSSGDW